MSAPASARLGYALSTCALLCALGPAAQPPLLAELPRLRPPPGARGSFLRLADLDRDGDLDMVRVYRTPGYRWTFRLLTNDGMGRFANASPGCLARAANSNAVFAIGDVDGDADPDIVITGNLGSELLLNDGRGCFRRAPAGSFPKDCQLAPSAR